MSGSLRLDAVDLEILRLLQEDARTTNRALATAVGVAPSTCLERVARMRRAGIILGHGLRLSSAALGRPLQAFLALRVRPHREPHADPFISDVTRLPGTRALFHIAGPDDFLVHVATTGIEELRRLVLEEFTQREEVLSVHTTLIFEEWSGGPLLPPLEDEGTARP